MQKLQLASRICHFRELNHNHPPHPSLCTRFSSYPLFLHFTPHQLTTRKTVTRPLDNQPRVLAPRLGFVHLSLPLPLLVNHPFIPLSPRFAHRTSLPRRPLSLERASVFVMYLLHFQAVLQCTRSRWPQCRPPAAYPGFNYFVSHIASLCSRILATRTLPPRSYAPLVPLPYCLSLSTYYWFRLYIYPTVSAE